MKTRLTLIIALAAIAFISCESQRQISVHVFDKNTGAPLDSVLVDVNAGKNGDYTKSSASGYTDESGHFETSIMIGCTFGCYDIQTTYTKDNYKTVVLLNDERDTVEMQPTENE
ncbi:MAG TPA: hypothetical protein VJ946_01650 [Bacteroidales bacterium]|nr:hypothetical protein [Bacteroidales bacterium]